MATPLELEHDRWEAGLFAISYPKEYKKRLCKIHRLYSEEIIFPVKHSESVFYLLTHIHHNFLNRL